MRSVVEELLDKISAESPGGARAARSQARADLGMLLFERRKAIDALWKAADAAVRAGAALGTPEAAALAAAVDPLRPLFGPRA